MLYEELTKEILGACFEVCNELGCGFLESVYEKALLITLIDAGLKAESQVPLNVMYRYQLVGAFYADIVVENTVLIELKAVRRWLRSTWRRS
jgi:GxxExxY protein